MFNDLFALHDMVKRVEEFIAEYAWHARDCGAVDRDGQWILGADCDCGYKEALAVLERRENGKS